jgi:uncharacterized repeat protein (TIGR02543 family)
MVGVLFLGMAAVAQVMEIPPELPRNPIRGRIDADDYGLDRAIQVMAAVQVSTPQITLTWPTKGLANPITVYRKAKGATSWGTAIATLASDATSYVDSTVEVETGYEYMVHQGASYSASNPQGYVYAGINLPAVHARGKVVLLVAENQVAGLGKTLSTLTLDLVGDGWQVIRHDIHPFSSPSSVKDLVKADYDADPTNVKAVYIFGHVPVPYSGCIAPDGHGDHVGAWPADGYYGDMNGTWTDTVNYSTGTGRVTNVAGDGKFDQSTFSGVNALELYVGRVDLYNMPAFALSETQLLSQYINKAHAFRVGTSGAAVRGLVEDNFNFGEGFSQSGWRVASLVGAANIAAKDFSTLTADDHLWAYGAGSGGWTSAGGIATTADFAASTYKAMFYMLFGSYFGDWDVQNSFLRAPLGNPTYGLTNVWAGRPHWFFHHMGLGETVGYAHLPATTSGIYASGSSTTQVHIALMGDPTLRLKYVKPPTSVMPVAEDGSVDLAWTASAEPGGVAGYHVYRAASMDAPFTRLTASLVVGVTFHDDAPLLGRNIYQVRAIKLEETPYSGSYYNNSIGAFATVDLALLTLAADPVVGGATIPEAGNYIVDASLPVDIGAHANPGYVFAGWTVTSGNATLGDASLMTTTVTLADVGGATVTANFALEATLTMAASPPAGGGTTPVPGPSTVPRGVPVDIAATTTPGYLFTGWQATANAAVADPDALVTTVILSGNATVTATFAIPDSTLLTLVADPPAGGTTSPAAGTHAAGVGLPFAIGASPNPDYVFAGWTVTVGNAVLGDASLMTTTVVVADTGGATVTANFVPSVVLTMVADPPAGGTTAPVPGVSTVGQGLAVDIGATPVAGYRFLAWEASANAALADANAMATTVTLSGDATVTAIFGEQAVVWNVDANGNWETLGNWLSGTRYPDGIGDIAVFGFNLTAMRTVSLNAPVTLGGIVFNDTDETGQSLFSNAGYSLDLKSSAITLDTGTPGYDAGDLVTIDLPTTNRVGHRIVNTTSGGKLILVDNVLVHAATSTLPLANDGRVEFSMGSTAANRGALAGSGNLTKTGPGQLLPHGDSDTYTGTIRIEEGVVQGRGSYNATNDIGKNAFGTGTVELTNGSAAYAAGLGMNNYKYHNIPFSNPLILEQTHATRSFDINAVAMNYVWAGNISSRSALNVNVLFNTYGRASNMATLAGDNSGLTMAMSRKIQAYMTIGVGSDNALGAGNVIPVEQLASQYQSGFLATVPTTIASAATVQNGTTGVSVAAATLGGNLAVGTATFTGPVTLNSNASADVRQVLLRSETGGTVVFASTIGNSSSNGNRAPVTKVGGGRIDLNGNNTFLGTTTVRSGTLVLGHDKALGNAATTVSLGEATPLATVRLATTGYENIWTWAADSYTGASTSVDGVALVAGDRILVKDNITVSRNGIYVVQTPTSTWTRATDMDESAELSRGQQVAVTEGIINGGKAFFQIQASPLTLNTSALDWHQDVANPEVAILANGAVTIARNIAVVANGSSGASMLGGLGDANAVFSGTVTLARNLQLSSAAVGGNRTTVSGVINDAASSFALTKVGDGRVELTNANTYDGGTLVSEGTLGVGNATGSATGTGPVTVTAGATLAGNGTVSGAVTVAGSIRPDSASVIGTLTTGPVQLDDAAVQIAVDGGSASRLAVVGNLNLSGSCSLDVDTFAAPTAPSYTAISYSGTRTGAFANVTPGYAVSYDDPGKQVLITPSLNTYVVTYNANGATSGSAPGTQTKTHGVDLTLATNSGFLARTGYSFVGWNTAANGSRINYAVGATYTVNADVTLYAKWRLNTYAVTYNANGATSGTAPGTQTKMHDVNLTLATNSGSLARTGYSFVGWNTAANGSRINYAVGATYTVNADVTLYAKWTPNFAINEYTVVFRTDGTPGALVNGAQAVTYTVAHGSDCTPVVAEPPPGQGFTGWSGDYVGMANPLSLANVVADMTVTASFGKWVAQGLVVDLDAADVDGLTTPGTFFRKPKLYAVYHDPVKDPDQLLTPKKASLKVLDKIDQATGATTLGCEWIKKIKLYSSKDFKAAQKAGTDAATWLAADGNQADLVLDLHTSTKEADPADQSVYGAFLAAPEILTATLGSAEGVSVVTIEGMWFGTKKPKVSREYTDAKTGTVIKQQKYKVLAPTDPAMVDGKGKRVYMNPRTGKSKAVVLVLTQDPAGNPTGDLVLDNGVGLAVGPDPTAP